MRAPRSQLASWGGDAAAATVTATADDHGWC